MTELPLHTIPYVTRFRETVSKAWDEGELANPKVQLLLATLSLSADYFEKSLILSFAHFAGIRVSDAEKLVRGGRFELMQDSTDPLAEALMMVFAGYKEAAEQLIRNISGCSDVEGKEAQASLETTDQGSKKLALTYSRVLG
ncbi:hypothetical protein BJ508DRAFT_320833 [Ascobolus immersus RN42]|uniref:Uncharacterized protein n=1 Tax=Ascobolus immersus RN42 TaxID=1160509 RepID=A0A3N4ISZ4_ASCIM|nr:hypothetical protein BJ508DRAFT_320833 [Ascobolus immersus RN42]